MDSDEETKTEEEKVEEEGTEGAAEEPPKVIEIHPPEPFDAPELEPLIDIFMEKRGLKDRKQAAIKLANVMWRQGINPQRDIQNVSAYINSMSNILEGIPDTMETQPVKGAIMGSTAVHAGRMINRAYLGEEDDTKEMMRYAQRMGITMRMIDKAFSGGGGEESPGLKSVNERLDRIEKAKEMEAVVKPLQDQISRLSEQVKDLSEGGRGRKGEEPSAEMKAITDTLDKIGKRLDDMDQRYEFNTVIQGLKDEFNNVKTEVSRIKEGGGTDNVKQLESLLGTMETIWKRIETLSGKGTPEGVDWRATAISTFGEITKEGIKAAEKVATGRKEEEKTKEPQGVSERIIDKLVMNHCMKEIAKGVLNVNVEAAAKELDLTPKQVYDSIMRLKEKGIFDAKIQGGVKSEQEAGEKEGAQRPRTEGIINP